MPVIYNFIIIRQNIGTVNIDFLPLFSHFLYKTKSKQTSFRWHQIKQNYINYVTECYKQKNKTQTLDILYSIDISDETNNNFRPNTNTNNIRFSKSTEYEYE